MNRKSIVFLSAFLLAIIAWWAVFLNNINTYNKSEHKLLLTEDNLKDGEYTDGKISVRLGARENGPKGTTSSWICGGPYEDENGLVEDRSYLACIYEFTITNLTDKTITDWKFTIGMSEDVNLNAGWNGEFTIHQNVASGEKTQTIKAENLKPEYVSLYNYCVKDIFLIPLYRGDYFIYEPVESAQEIPIVPADPDHNTYFSKTMGFVLHIQDKAEGYLTTFENGEVTYTLYRELYQEGLFYVLIFVSVIWIAVLISILIIIGKEKKFAEKQEHDMKIVEQSIRVFVEFLEAKDPRTKGHSMRVAQYSKLLAKEVGYSDEECQNIYFTGLMHDCGKVSIPEEILCKPGELTDDEYEIMKSHAQKGYSMLEKFDAIPYIGQGALYHHERYDGTGYPAGLKGDEIPRIGRLIAVADAFDTMTSIRCYRKALDKETVLEELKSNKGKQFDPEMVDALLALIKRGEIKIRE